MAKTVVKTLQTETLVIEETGHYVIAKKGVIDVDLAGVAGYGHGIYMGGSTDGTRIDVLGRVQASLSNHTAIFLQDANARLNVGASGFAQAEAAVIVNALGTRIRNEGELRGITEGIDYYMGETDLVNGEGGMIRGQIGVRIGGDGGMLVNAGKIIGESYAVFNQSGERLELTNTGPLRGDVFLGNANDFFLNRGGTVDGVVKGGLGNDVFRIIKHNIVVQELGGEGQDLIQTRLSHALEVGASIEILVALGKADIKLTGNDLNNQVIGNKGDNILSGLGGADLISGGRGNDLLSGGEGIDTFSFVNGSGRDIITDFVTGIDRLNFEHYQGVASADDLAMFQKGSDVIIELHDGDRIVLKGQDGVNTDDFLFAIT